MTPPVTRSHTPQASPKQRNLRDAATTKKGVSARRKPLERHLTLREKILETIRDDILRGRLQPGEKVAEPELAERFGISRTPIREALRQLESEGYLTVVPRRGAIVTALTETEIEELYAIKSILEGYAAQVAAARMSAKEIERLEALNQRLESLSLDGDTRNFFKVHNEFHDAFVKAAGNEKLAELIGQLAQKFNRMRMASLTVPGRMTISVQEHKKIINALRQRNGEEADRMVRETAAHGAQVLIQSLATAEGRRKVEDVREVIQFAVDV